MNIRTGFAILLLSLFSGLMARAQSAESSSGITEPPKLLLLVHQQIRFGKESERAKLGVAIKRACDRVSVPNSWIDLESVTGTPEALFFDPFDSFEETEQAGVSLSQIFAAHPEIARFQEHVSAV